MTILSAILFVLTGVTAQASSPDCIRFDPSARLITVSCESRFRDIAEALMTRQTGVLRDLGSGEWLLSATIEVLPQAQLTIHSGDVRWLKIDTAAPNRNPYSILARGKLTIDGVKITSWNQATGSVVEQNAEGSVLRPSIRMTASRGSSIRNSEIAYLGCKGNYRQAVRFDQGSEFGVVEGNRFHHNWYAFYSDHAVQIEIRNNEYFANLKYAIDPHTRTRQIAITGNHVHHNDGIGIICAFECSDVLIENNHVHDNTHEGVMLSEHGVRATFRGNVIYNQKIALELHDTSESRVENNLIYASGTGIFVDPTTAASGNVIENNTVQDCDYGVHAWGSNGNLYRNNRVRRNRIADFRISHSGVIDITEQLFENTLVKAGPEGGILRVARSGRVCVDGKPHDTWQSPLILEPGAAGHRLESRCDGPAGQTLH